ncbi:unnamed protein product [Linum tenue]|uniref:Uncharacterized protein n=1 Tax=Linum tenue TaxID=586396 RepID=A0AAV0LDE6_9ROSI|nr:unnamed protein product [Linum tenue]
MESRISAEVKIKLGFLFCILVLAITSSAGGAGAAAAAEMRNNSGGNESAVVPDSDEEYCRLVVCKGLNCGKVYAADGTCWCVLKQGPLVALPCAY